jgi:hypothetical protein
MNGGGFVARALDIRTLLPPARLACAPSALADSAVIASESPKLGLAAPK